MILGCTNPEAENYNPKATKDDGSCRILGCTDRGAKNFNPKATDDDGSCRKDPKDPKDTKDTKKPKGKNNEEELGKEREISSEEQLNQNSIKQRSSKTKKNLDIFERKSKQIISEEFVDKKDSSIEPNIERNAKNNQKDLDVLVPPWIK